VLFTVLFRTEKKEEGAYQDIVGFSDLDSYSKTNKASWASRKQKHRNTTFYQHTEQQARNVN
jgi:hypothetical protein